MKDTRVLRFGNCLKAVAAAVAIPCITVSAAYADDLYRPGSWSNLAGDRTAERVGDGLTVLIQQASQASDSTQSLREGDGSLFGRYQSGSNNSDQAGLSGDYKLAATGRHGRSGQMISQISVVVDDVLPNGDLHVSGNQLLNINGEKTQIHLTGRVRRTDISNTNTVVSTSLSDLKILYGGPGLNGGNEKPGVIKRMFSWLKQ